MIQTWCLRAISTTARRRSSVMTVKRRVLQAPASGRRASGAAARRDARNLRGSGRPHPIGHDAAPAHQRRAAGDRGVGEVLEHDPVAGGVVTAMTAMMAAWAPSVGTMSAGAGAQPASASQRAPASSQCGWHGANVAGHRLGRPAADLRCHRLHHRRHADRPARPSCRSVAIRRSCVPRDCLRRWMSCCFNSGERAMPTHRCRGRPRR